MDAGRTSEGPTVHASAVLVGARALLVRGPAGSGKSRLVLRLLQAGEGCRAPFARLVADDRTHIEPRNGRLLARPAAALAGLLEVRGLGLRSLPFEPVAVIGWIADLGAEAPRLPGEDDAQVVIHGVTLPRFAFPACADPLPVLLAALGTKAATGGAGTRAACAVQHYRQGA